MKKYLIVVRRVGESETSTNFAHPNCYLNAKAQLVEPEYLRPAQKRRRA
jgi:hypothetical protein